MQLFGTNESNARYNNARASAKTPRRRAPKCHLRPVLLQKCVADARRFPAKAMLEFLGTGSFAVDCFPEFQSVQHVSSLGERRHEGVEFLEMPCLSGKRLGRNEPQKIRREEVVPTRKTVSLHVWIKSSILEYTQNE